MSNFGGGDIPTGDTFRIDITSTDDATEATILNKTGKGIVTGLLIESPNIISAVSIRLTSLKVTVDGATERELIASGLIMHKTITSVGQRPAMILPGIWIKYKTSLVMKITWTDATGTTTGVDVAVMNHVE
jgi:hypothetical protein